MRVTGSLSGNVLILDGDLESKENNDIINDYNKKLTILSKIIEMNNEEVYKFVESHSACIKEKIILEERKNYAAEIAVEKYKVEKMTKELEDLRIKLEMQSTISYKGTTGELFVESYIDERIRLNENWSITNISKDGNHNSDLELVYKNIKCVIEVKNIKTKLSESNIKKFKETYINSEEKQYNCGIFVSLISDYSPSTGVYDFYIQTINNKYIIFLAKVKENPEKLLFAMDILNQIVSLEKNKSGHAIIEMLNKQIKNYGGLYSEVNKMLATIKTLKTNIKMYQDEIIETLSNIPAA